MAKGQDRVVIVSAVIGAVSVIAAAVITSAGDWFGSGTEPPPSVPPSASNVEPQEPAPTVAGPRAPPIKINTQFQLWGEQTKLIRLEPDEVHEIEGQALYAGDHSMAVQTSCAGPGFIAYTWQVRAPWPRGGEVEVHSYLPMGGGATELVETGSTGSSTMGACGIHQFKNVDLEPVTVEIRYASAA